MLLATMALGYWVCLKADEKKGFLKELGYWIGCVIIVASVIIALCKPVCGVLFKKGPCMGQMPGAGKMMMMHKCPTCGGMKK
ncbi:MAG: hypothetical protein NTV07_06800 [Candidatus Omnitrophica bacterium]|nr:hypothetical protein [Candidatus Omnitrophota bacterium]